MWQEKWEIVQKENKSLKERISQLETEVQKLKNRNDQLDAMKIQVDHTKKENQNIIAENPSLKTRIGQVEANDLTRRQ